MFYSVNTKIYLPQYYVPEVLISSLTYSYEIQMNDEDKGLYCNSRYAIYISFT